MTDVGVMGGTGEGVPEPAPRNTVSLPPEPVIVFWLPWIVTSSCQNPAVFGWKNHFDVDDVVPIAQSDVIAAALPTETVSFPPPR